MSSELDALSASTTASLTSLFAELGVEAPEAQALLRALSDSVRDVFAAAVATQERRAAGAAANISELSALIASLQRSMEEAEDVVRTVPPAGAPPLAPQRLRAQPLPARLPAG